MSHTIHRITTWVHSQPVAHVAWACLVIAVAAALLFALPSILKRIRSSGSRAGLRLSLLTVVLLAGLAVDVALVKGYRTRIGQTYAQQTAKEYADVLLTHHPFHIDSYYAFQRQVRHDQTIAGTIPELRVGGRWTSLRTRATFNAPIVGAPPDLRGLFTSQASTSLGFDRMLATWQSALRKLAAGHCYLSEQLAQAEGLSSRDIIYLQARGRTTYLTVSGILPSGQLAGVGPAVIVPLDAAQAELGMRGLVSRVEVVYSGTSGGRRGSRQSLLRKAATIPVASVSRSPWTFVATISRTVTGDFDRWLAVGATATALLASLLLAIVGLTSRPRA